MRDPERIKKFCDRLAAVWQKVPDLRFFQLMICIQKNIDLFYWEDDAAIELIEQIVEEWLKK